MERFNLIVVDAGASKKIDDLASELSKSGYKFDIIQCHKKRNISTGQIEKLEVYCESLNNNSCIIVDDIADGAASFIFCVKELQKINGYKNSFLVVSYGIFSKGLSELSNYFDGIYTTNSYKEQARPKFETTKEQKLVKQLNIF